MKRLLTAFCLMTLTACVTPNQGDPQAEVHFLSTVPTCGTEAQCERAWSAARRWVLDHSDYKLQHYANDFMETFSGGSLSTSTWARVTKEPADSGAYRILVELGCDNLFSCSLSPLAQAKQSFNDYVNAAIAVSP